MEPPVGYFIKGLPDRQQGPSTRRWGKWPSWRIRPQPPNQASKREDHDQGVPERPRSSGARRRSTGSVRTGRRQSPAPRTSDRSRTPDRVRSPIRHQAMDRDVTPDKGKSRANPATPTFPTDYPMEEPVATPPSRSASMRDPRTASGRQHSQQPAGSNPAASPSIRNARF